MSGSAMLLSESLKLLCACVCSCSELFGSLSRYASSSAPLLLPCPHLPVSPTLERHIQHGARDGRCTNVPHSSMVHHLIVACLSGPLRAQAGRAGPRPAGSDHDRASYYCAIGILCPSALTSCVCSIDVHLWHYFCQ